MPDERVIAGKYRLIAKLSKGGMGSVWRAQHLELDCPAAVKLLDPAFADSPEALARFKREAQSAASLRSAHIVQIFDFGVDSGTPYIAMELLRGRSLADHLADRSPLSPAESALILSQVARAVAWAHSRGIIHRDLKPGNIFISEDAGETVVKLVDFGIAKPAPTQALHPPVTVTGAIMGTPQYMSPEQASGRGVVDHRTDIWSFGIVAFECLTGYHAFAAETLASLLLAICTDPLPVPSQVGPVPTGFDEWFARCAQRDQNLRFSSIAQAADELREICGVAAGTQLRAIHFERTELPETLCSTSNDGKDVANAPDVPATTHSASITSLVASGVPQRRRSRYLILAGLFGIGAVAALTWFAFDSSPAPTNESQALASTGGVTSETPAPPAPPGASSPSSDSVAPSPILLLPSDGSPSHEPASIKALTGQPLLTKRKGKSSIAQAQQPGASPSTSAEAKAASTSGTPVTPMSEETVESEFGFSSKSKQRGNP